MSQRDGCVVGWFYHGMHMSGRDGDAYIRVGGSWRGHVTRAGFGGGVGGSWGCVLQEYDLSTGQQSPQHRAPVSRLLRVCVVSAKHNPGKLVEKMKQVKERGGERLKWMRVAASHGFWHVQASAAVELG